VYHVLDRLPTHYGGVGSGCAALAFDTVLVEQDRNENSYMLISAVWTGNETHGFIILPD
jgi:hypothetical protein